MSTPNDEIGWETFTEGLAAGLGENRVDDAVISSYGERRSAQYIQYLQNVDTITLEVSNFRAAPLTQQQRVVLAVLGWEPPARGPDANWTKTLPWQPDPHLLDATAQMIVGVLRDVLAVPAPQNLRIEAFNVATGEAFWLPFTGLEHQRAVADAALRQADLRLHEAAATYVIEKQGLDARVVAVLTMAADRRPNRADAGEYFVDRILYVGGLDPHILVWSHIGPSGRRGSRLVPPHPPVDGPYIRAEQGSAAYVRDLLQRNRALTEILDTDHDVRDLMNAALATGRHAAVRAASIAVDASGVITVTGMVLPPHVIDVPTLHLSRF